MKLLEFFLECLKVLVWPITLLVMLLTFLKYLKSITDFNQRVTMLNHDNNVEFILQKHFKLICQNFFDQPLHVRKQAAREIQYLSHLLSVDRITEFSYSMFPGERVGAGIALHQHILNSKSYKFNKRIHDAIAQGITDSQSRVRYRFVAILRDRQVLAKRYQKELKDLVQKEENKAVQQEALEALINADLA